MTAKKIITQIRSLKPRDKEYLYSVPDQRGLYLAVRPDGTKWFALRYTSPVTKKRRLMLLDGQDIGAVRSTEAPDVFDEAVAQAIRLRRDIKNGLDPLEVAREEQRSTIRHQADRIESTQLNVELMCEWYIGSLYGGYTKEQREGMSDKQYAAMVAAGRRSAPVVEKALAKDVYPLIGHIRASEATVKDCVAVRNEIAKRGARSQANRVLAYVTAAFNFAVKAQGKAGSHGALDAYYSKVPDFGVSFNPAAMVERYSEDQSRRANERTLSNHEIARVWKEAGQDCMSPQLALALKLLLSTGQRVEEVLEATKDEFLLDQGLWVIPQERRKTRFKTKHNEPHIIPLEPQHIDIIKRARQLAGRGKYLFPSREGGPRTSNALKQAVLRFCVPQGISKRKGMDKFTPRDCRRSFKTLALMAGADSEALDRLQGHNVKDISSEHYDRYDRLPEKRRAMQTYLQALEVLADTPTEDPEELRSLMLERFPPDNVVPLKRA